MRNCVDCGTDLSFRHESHIRCVACYVVTLHKEIASGEYYFKEALDALPPLRSGLMVDIESLPEHKQEKIKRMRDMSAQGMTRRGVAKQFDLSAARVGQLLSRVGASHGRKEFVSRAKEKKRLQQAVMREARCFDRWGMGVEEYKRARNLGYASAFVSQRGKAKNRGIAWNMNLAEWCAVWDASGKFALRGRGIGKYCMSRLLDEGGYSVGNVHIQLAQENSRETWTNKKRRS